MIQPTKSSADASDALSGEWWLYATPFLHFRAKNVLNQHDYARVESAFRETLNSIVGTGSKELAKAANYDANIISMSPKLAPIFAPFFSRSWIEKIHRLLSLRGISRLDGALHSSAPGSRTGWIHTDFCSAWFDESGDTSIYPVFPNRVMCDYFTGKAKSGTARPIEYVRAATLIYYLCNDGWQIGDGGETGIYSRARDGSRTASDMVPPVNNTLLLFPCSPHSYHRFITNPKRTRNSIILWLHSTIEDATAIWGSGVNRRLCS
jgi:hypothetical protein